jgi:hypothetical protein
VLTFFVIDVRFPDHRVRSGLPTIHKGRSRNRHIPRFGSISPYAIDRFSDSPQTERVTILLVCAHEDRLNRLKDAIHSGGFRTISARGIDDAWVRTDFFDVGAVVIDYELKNDIAASAFRQRFITLNLNEDAPPEAVVVELTNLFSRGSELVQ